uniref:GSVIVT00036358001 n=1 Tax=Arundo donax TaxID=35708 RepID=A0A0A9BVZ3_ARUDO
MVTLVSGGPFASGSPALGSKKP